MDKLQLEVLTPGRILLETEADHVVLPGSMGEMGILPQHIPVVTMLNGGVLIYFVEQKQSYLAVQGGYAQVDNNRVTVLVERAAFAEGQRWRICGFGWEAHAQVRNHLERASAPGVGHGTLCHRCL